MSDGLLRRPALGRRPWSPQTGSRRSRSAVLAVAFVAAFAAMGELGGASRAQVEREPELAPLVARLTGEQLPKMYRFSVHIASLVARIRQDDGLTAAQDYMEAAFGLKLDASELQLLSTLYGDFDRMQQETHKRELSRPGIEQAEIEELGRDLSLQRYEHQGRVLGQWAAQLRQNGHDTDHYLRDVAFNPDRNVSVSFGGSVPSPQELENREMVFEDAFEAAYGRALDDVLAEDTAPSGGQ